MTLHVNNSGTFIEPDEVFVKNGGVWRAITETYVNDNGTWRKIFPESGTQTFSTTGTYSFVVPQGIYSLSMPIMSGGGGGGATGYHSGDCHSGFAGSAGAAYTSSDNIAISVTPGETLTVIVGAGGAGGCCWAFQAPQVCGVTGSTTYVKRGATTLYSRSGGSRGCGFYDTGTDFTSPGGTNGTGYGTGGTGGSCTGNGGAGVAGAVQFSWS